MGHNGLPAHNLTERTVTMANVPSGSEPRPGPFALAFAAEVRSLLARHRMSGAQLAKLTGRSQSYMSKRLRGESSFTANDAEAICRAMDLDLETLLVTAVRGIKRP